MEENQTHIPEGWFEDTILELCHIGRGRVISQKEITENIGEYPVYSSQTQNNGEMGRIDTFDFEGNFITWTTDGANAGTVFYRTGKFNCTNVCGTLQEKKENVDLKFLAYKLSTVAKNHVSYVGNPKLMNGTMSKVSLVLPKSKTEQTQIATILSKVDEAITQTEQLIAKYTRIKTGLMQDLLTKGIDENDNIRSEETHEFKDSPLGRIPKEWECVNFGEYIELVHGYQFRNYDFTETGISVVKIGQVKENGLDLSQCSFINPNRAQLFAKQTINNGDVLMALTGATLGKACIVSGLNSPVMQNYRVGRFEPIFINDVDKTFLFYTLKSSLFLGQIFNNVNEAAQGNVGKSDFKKSFFIKPPFEEQLKIVQYIEKIFNLVDDFNLELNKLQSLKTGLMQDLLSGKVRVNHLIKETANL